MPQISDILNKNLLVITAHPDDESYFAAGTIYANKQVGGTTNLICATLGEKGKSHLERDVSDEEMKSIRHKELHEVAGTIGIDQVFELQFPDGKVTEFKPEITEKINSLLPQLKPEIILSFGSDGITGHKDHIAISEVASEVARAHNLIFAACCVPSSVITEAHDWLMSRRRTAGHYVDDFVLNKGNLEIPIESQPKIKALNCYCSQIDKGDPFAGFPENIVKAICTSESFYITKNNLNNGDGTTGI